MKANSGIDWSTYTEYELCERFNFVGAAYGACTVEQLRDELVQELRGRLARTQAQVTRLKHTLGEIT